MAKKKGNDNDPAPSSRRPWPKSGTSTMDAVFTAVGRALSTWERHEFLLSILFASFVADEDALAARRAYSAVRIFEGRIGMLKAASEAFFERKPNANMQQLRDEVVRDAEQFAKRRNDIAHGIVHYYYRTPDQTGELAQPPTYALYPSQASVTHRDISDRPSYCMTEVELTYFHEQFSALHLPAFRLAETIRRFRKMRPLPRDFYNRS